MTETTIASQSGIVRVDITDNAALYAAYMPFVLNGGLFVAQRFFQNTRYDLGSDVFLLLHLMAQDERLPVAGKVIWISPRATTRPQGIGIQFISKDNGATQRRIETLLAGQLTAAIPTHTL
jgi:type IV pilus assembly protein PilZ